MRQRAIWLGSFGVGLAGALLFDPISGNRRRHRLADAAVHLRRQARRTALAVGRDLSKRTRGIIATARQRLRQNEADDVVLEERVHSVLGHVVSHQHAITVRVDDGHVTLDGPIPQEQRNRIAGAVRAIAGVKDVRTRFDSHIQPAHEPSSNSPTHLVLPRRTPSTRAIIAGSGAALVGAALMRRDRTGAALAVTGVALIARVARNLATRRADPGRRLEEGFVNGTRARHLASRF
jgi:BON domain